MELSLSVEDIARIVEATDIRGATTETIRGIASLELATRGDVSFLGNPKYKPKVATTGASALLLPADYAGQPGPDQVFLIVGSPSVALAKLCSRIEHMLWPKPVPGIHPTAIIGPGARIAASATIGPLCVIENGSVIGERTFVEAQAFIGHDVRIGNDCWLMPRVVISAQCELRDRVRLQPGVVIGADGFGYEYMDGRHAKVPQIGNVVVENDVEIGAGTTIDRARFSHTRIGEGTKIDNLVQIAHNVVIGKHCLICAQVGISGSTTLGDFVVAGGQAGLAGHITIGRGAKLGGQAGVSADVPPGVSVKGTPCLPLQLEQRINVLRQRLPDLFKRVAALEEKTEKTSAPS